MARFPTFKLLLSFTLFTLFHTQGVYGACQSLLQDAKRAADTMQKKWFLFGTYMTGAAWTNANAVEDLNNLMLGLGINDYERVIDSVFVWDEVNLNTAKSYDDVQWVVLTYFKVCDFLAARGKSTSKCMARADQFYKIAASAWDDSKCGGGVYWSGARDYKNAITNHLFILTSSEYYRRTGNQAYLDNAKKTWNWLKGTNMRNGDGLYNDGLDINSCSNNGQTVWTYNQAVIASGLASLSIATGDKSLLQEAQISLDATISRFTTNGILRETCDDAEKGGQKCDPDQMIFKGIFTKHLQYFLDMANDPLLNAKYAGFLGAQASAVIHYGKRSDDVIGSVWYAPDHGGSQFTHRTQASGLAALIAAAKYSNC